MPRIHEAVASYLANSEWSYDDLGDYFSSPVSGNHGSWVAFLAFHEQDELLVMYSIVPVDVPAARRTAVALYLSRANYGLAIGNFEIDLDDGEVRFKTSLDVAGAELTEVLIDHLFLTNIVTVDRYLDGLRAVVAGNNPAPSVSTADQTPPV